MTIPLALAAVWTGLCLSLFGETAFRGFHHEWILKFWEPLPFRADAVLLTMGRHLLSLAVTVLVCLAALGAAQPLIRWIWPGREPPRGAVALALGLILVLPMGLLGLGLTGLLHRPVLVCTVLCAALWSRGWVAQWKSHIGTWSTCRWTWMAGAFLLAPSLLCALAPQSQYDALQYHFSLPRQFLSHGKIFLAEPQPLSSLPLAEELLFSVGMALGGDEPAQLLNWVMFPLLLFLVAGAARTLGLNGTLATAAWLLLAASPLFSWLAGQAFTDLAPTLAVIAALSLRLSSSRPGSALLFGLCLGAAGAAKLSGGTLALCVLLPLAPRHGRILALCGWVLPQALWAAKNFLLTSSPFGGTILTTWWPTFLQSEEALSLARAASWVSAGHPSLWLWFPKYLLQDAVQAGHEISPLLVALLPAGLLSLRRDSPRLGQRLGIAAVASFALWALAGNGQVRHLAPALPILILGALAPLAGLSLSRKVMTTVRATLLCVVALGWARMCVGLFQLANPLNVALGLEPQRPYLSRLITPSHLYLAVGAHLEDHPELGRPYSTGDIKAYYWPRDPLVDSQYMLPHLMRWARDAHDARALFAKFRQHDVGCLVHRMDGSLTMQEIANGYPWTDHGLAVLQQFMVRHLARAGSLTRPHENAFYYFYRVEPSPQPPPAVDSLHWLHIPYTELLCRDADLALEQGRLREAATQYQALARRFPSFAIPSLRLAEVAKLSGNPVAERQHEHRAARLLGM